MRQLDSHRSAVVVAGLCAVTLIVAACGGDDSGESAASQVGSVAAPSGDATSGTVAQSPTGMAPTKVTITGRDDVEVTLSGPLAVKYATATAAQKSSLGKPLTGDRNAGTRESGAVFQQFEGGVIIAKNNTPGTPAYIITSGKIRDAWNTERAPDGTPSITGQNGSPGPLGVPVSDLITEGDHRVVTFEHGEIAEKTTTGEVTVTVNGKVVPSGLN